MNKKIKTIAAIAAMSLAALTLPATSSARTYTRCDYYGHHCVRVHCDWDGDRCWRRSSYYHHRFYTGHGHWICGRHRNDCRWAYDRWDRHHRWHD